MSVLDRLSVGAKLGLAFAIVLMITAGLGVLSLVQLSRVDHTANELAAHWLPSVRQVQLINLTVTRYRTREYRFMLDDGEARKADAAKIDQSRQAVEEQLKRYETLVSSSDEAAKLKDVRALWATYLELSTRMMQTAQAGDEGQARKMLTVDGLPRYEALGKALEELVELNSASAQAANELGDRIYATSRWEVVAITILAMALGTVFAAVITRRITRPLRASVRLAEAVAIGDLTQTLRPRGSDEVAQLQQALLRMVTQLKAVVAEVREGVVSVSSASSQIAIGNEDLSARTEQTASNLEEAASSMEELTGALAQSSDTARQANQLAGSAAEAATRGGRVVGQVVARMGDISSASQRISDIIGTIDGIAFQTNILALNAAVEAARAGEQGRGFAVVASEVRSLAQRSAEAAKEIKNLITRSVETVQAGTVDVAQAGHAMDDIVSGVRRVTDLMGEIAAASTEQSNGIGQVNQAVAQLDQMTQQNAALVEESSAAATSLREQAKRLEDVVSVFKVA
ncbi:methyl-accepting chemotaxis protein [Roseateles amylovorans]|uniref:Methyl-accepting chemotaxis protein n=1 Tax=Roseateles amylovorans TaxID=2978473 RepID=A0ABY6B3P7_9BURK|nr:methyl-accepting chemotaxis protein [Roseateles amylovorans]UXH79472.1 methyl-accepting chemotaxis protein [Roseateles amylovorans]